MINLKTKSELSQSPPKFLEKMPLKKLNGETVELSDYWKDNTIIVKVLRRFGCPLCRFESKLLSDLQSEFETIGVKMIAIGFDEIGVKEFQAEGYWTGELLIDSEHTLGTALSLKQFNLHQGFSDLVSSSTRAAARASLDNGISGNLSGDLFQLGGTFIFEKGTGNMIYEFRQSGAGRFPSLSEIQQVCGKKISNIEELAPKECVVYLKPRDTELVAPIS